MSRLTESAGDAGPLADLIRSTERQRLCALVRADMEVADRLHADDFQLITPGGGAMSKETYLGGIASGRFRYVAFEPTSEIVVRLHGDVALIRYQSRIELVNEGQPGGLRAWHTDTYEERNGLWRIVWSQATEIR
ncbi:MAG: nuclear transport factor 2 family protein [Chloroflexia bacterium]|jgi:hypothetical protein|nr:nuclear transport factor 2 family protein [Chloroflexia bacterium]